MERGADLGAPQRTCRRVVLEVIGGARVVTKSQVGGGVDVIEDVELAPTHGAQAAVRIGGRGVRLGDDEGVDVARRVGHLGRADVRRLEAVGVGGHAGLFDEVGLHERGRLEVANVLPQAVGDSGQPAVGAEPQADDLCARDGAAVGASPDLMAHIDRAAADAIGPHVDAKRDILPDAGKQLHPLLLHDEEVAAVHMVGEADVGIAEGPPALVLEVVEEHGERHAPTRVSLVPARGQVSDERGHGRGVAQQCGSVHWRGVPSIFGAARAVC